MIISLTGKSPTKVGLLGAEWLVKIADRALRNHKEHISWYALLECARLNSKVLRGFDGTYQTYQQRQRK